MSRRKQARPIRVQDEEFGINSGPLLTPFISQPTLAQPDTMLLLQRPAKRKSFEVGDDIPKEINESGEFI